MQFSYKTLDEAIIKRKTVLKIPWLVDDSIHKEALLNYVQITKPVSFFVQTPQVTRNVRRNIKMSLYIVAFKTKFRLTWNWYGWRIKSFWKMAPQELLVLGIENSFWNSLSKIYVFVVTVYKIFLTALLTVALAERSFCKLKMIKSSVAFHLPRIGDITLSYTNWKLNC